MKPTSKQLDRVFVPDKESREDRCRRVLAGVPKVKRATELRFDYQAATRIATRKATA